MGPRAARIHWLRGNASERTPRRLIVLDTESRTTETEPRELHELRCWVARVIIRSPESGEPAEWTQNEGTERAQITDLIERTVKAKASWRLFTHNLSYDLGLTRLPLDLLGRGWQIGRHNLASDQPWAYFKRAGRGLWLCDSWSWLPQPVETLGEMLGLAKLPLPHQDAPLEAWLARCRADVEITATALLNLMEEWDRRRLGWWSITGPASGWNTMLHFPKRSDGSGTAARSAHSADPAAHTGSARVLIVPDAEARAFERGALYSGRRDVWRVGKLKGGPWAEVDLKTAHLAICAHYPLPYRRWPGFDSLSLDDWRLEKRAAGLVASVIVNTPTPRYPLRVKGVVLHPVGRFQTVLAGPEILEARKRGELESIGRGYGYHLGHQMQDWACWSLGVLGTEDGSVEPMLRVAVKAWSRSVPGRWGMTHGREIKTGDSHVKDWALEPITVGSPPRRGYIFHLAGKWSESVTDQEADDSFPAVLAYVQSYCRLALNRLLDALPLDSLVSCNTEGAWVHQSALDAQEEVMPHTAEQSLAQSQTTSATLATLTRATWPLTVQLKRTAHTLQVLSPQHHRTEDARLYSGIPRAATEPSPERFQFLTWPKLRGQIERGDPRGYVREERTVNLAAVPVSRWSFQDGACEPVEVAWSPETGNVIQRLSPELERRHGLLRPSQHPVLRRVLASSAGT